MASVRMSNELRAQMKRAAIDAWDVANPQPKASAEFANELVLLIKNSEGQQNAAKVYEASKNKKFGTSFCFAQNNLVRKRETDSFAFIWDLSERPGESAGMDTVRIELPIKTEIFTNDHYYGLKLYASDITSEAHDNYVSLKNKHFDLWNRVDQYSTNRGEFEHQIQQLLWHCNTLKQLLEAWPAAESLVPQHLLQKMHEKVTRKQTATRVKEDINFDDTTANKALLAAKMLGGI